MLVLLCAPSVGVAGAAKTYKHAQKDVNISGTTAEYCF